MTKNQVHIVSVGTSILSNFRRDNTRAAEYLPSTRQEKDELLKYVKENPYRASAELNSLREFLEKGSVKKIYLIKTDTDECDLTSSTIVSYLAEKGVKVEGKTISGYYPKSGKRNWSAEAAEAKFIEDLTNLLNTLLDFIRHNKEEDIYLNATGGFKPEVTILTLAGSLTKRPVYYRHEYFQRVVYLPPIPVIKPNENLQHLLKNLKSSEGGRLTKSQLGKMDPIAIKDAEAYGLIEKKLDEFEIVREIKLTGMGKLLADAFLRANEWD